MSLRRPKRVAHLIQHKLSELLREEISDPRLQGILINDVEMSPDLKHAFIYYSDQMNVDTKQMETALSHAQGYLRRQLGLLQLRHVPELHFEEDVRGEAANRVLGLLHELEEARPS